jgi:hypothetical protein
MGLHSNCMIMEDTNNRYFTIISAPVIIIFELVLMHRTSVTLPWLTPTSDCSSSSPYSTCQHKLPVNCRLQRMMLSPHWLFNRRHSDHWGYHNRGSTAATLLLAEHMIIMYTYCMCNYKMDMVEPCAIWRCRTGQMYVSSKLVLRRNHSKRAYVQIMFHSA